jgi:hypothetical protein
MLDRAAWLFIGVIAVALGLGADTVAADPWRDKLKAAEARRAAPYRRALRNDKLLLALQHTAYILLPDGARVTPERLAAASVWFEDAMPERLCSDGQAVHTLWRYEFDAQHRLVKRSHQDYCGHPPDAAWR